MRFFIILAISTLASDGYILTAKGFSPLVCFFWSILRDRKAR